MSDAQKQRWTEIVAAGGKPCLGKHGKVYDTPNIRRKAEPAPVEERPDLKMEAIKAAIQQNPDAADRELPKQFQTTARDVERVRSDMLKHAEATRHDGWQAPATVAVPARIGVSAAGS